MAKNYFQINLDSCWHSKRKKNANSAELSELNLWKLANRHENLMEWKKIALELELKNSQIQEIESKFKLKDGLVECLYQVLLKWRLKNDQTYTIEYIESKLNLNDFNEINCEEMLNVYEKLFFESPTSLDSIKLNDKILWEISDYICVEWKSIARYLGIKESDICEIEIKYFYKDGLRECCYQALLKWSQLTNEFNLKYLCKIFIQQSFNYYAKKLIEMFM